MKKTLITLVIFYLSGSLLANCPEVLDHEVRGYTPQYTGLQNLYQDLKDEDFVILAFPSRDFLWQEFSDESDIKEFCSTEYGVTFPMFATSPVKGRNANNFYKELIKETGIEPGWNFHKYLIGRDGKVSSFNTKVEPNSSELISSIKSLL